MTRVPDGRRKGTAAGYSTQLLRDLRAFFGITFKITPDPESTTVLLSCLGTGYLNMNRKIT